jgi:hypothetical protein
VVAKHSDQSIVHFFWPGIIEEFKRVFIKYSGPCFANKQCDHEGNNLTIFKTITSYAVFGAMYIGKMLSRVL